MAPKTAEQLQEIRERSRNKILEAALRLFAEQGFHNTSISQITEEAGVSKGLLYNYFKKKEDLMDGIVAKALKEGEGVMIEMMKLTDPKEKLKFIIDYAFHQITERKEYFKLLVSLSLQVDLFPSVKHVVMGKYEGALPTFAPLFEAVGVEHPERETRFLSAFLDGIGIQYIVLGDALPMDKIKQDLFERYHLT